MTLYFRQREPLLSKITVRHGPLTLLGRFFPSAVRAVEERGVRLGFATFEDLMAANAANTDSWHGMVRTFDPEFSRLDEHDSFCILGIDRQGRVVTSIAARRFDWRQTTFAQEIASMRLFYARPDRDREPDEAMSVTPGTGDAIRAIVGWTGAAWCHPSMRGTGLPAINSRIARAVALTRWDTAFSVGMTSEKNYEKGYVAKLGHPHLGGWVNWQNSPVGVKRLALAWMTTDEFVADLQVFVEKRRSSNATLDGPRGVSAEAPESAHPRATQQR